jgi:iron(III) transport system ATP-binding protein
VKNPSSVSLPGIEFRGVSKRYGGVDSPLVVDHIGFTVAKGSLTTILGPSGCGKTTTLRMIAGLESASAGQIFIDGRDVTATGPAERNVSMVFQSYALFPHLSVQHNVMYGLSVTGVPRREADERCANALEVVGLQGYGERLPSELSGGQQQRLAHEAGDKFALRLFVQFLRRAGLRDAAGVHDDDLVAHGQCLALVVRDVGHRQLQALLQGAYFFAHGSAQACVQIGQWLIEEQHRGLQHERACQRHTLLLPA